MKVYFIYEGENNMNKIMILGTFHMQAQNDKTNFKETNKIHEHEAEIIRLVDAIAEFKPTQIAVEYSKSEQDALDAAYLKYLTNGSKSTNEIVQVAFRLAKKLGLEKVNAVDWMERGAAERPFGDVDEYLHTKQPELAQEMDALLHTEIDLEKETICDVFRRENSQTSVQDTLALYMNYARVGSEEYYGNGWLIWWYQRNLNIFTNLAALAENKNEERIFLLIGSSHKGILEQFFQNSMAFEVVDTTSYLEKLQ